MYIGEVTLTLCFIAIQLWYFWQSRKKIRSLKELFPSNDLSLISGTTSDIKVLGENEAYSTDFQDIIEYTNRYLINNKGAAANFDIIKDIAERINRSIENAINSTIAIPLYTGLLCTMFGILAGLWFMGGELNDDSLNSLLSGVKIAMTASFSGLFLTLINSAGAYKNAKNERDKRKDKYLTFIQTSLLPVLSRDMAKSLFNLEGQIGKFNRDFQQNIDNLASSLDGSVNMLYQNIDKQNKTVEKISKIPILDVAKKNADMFTRFNETADNFSKIDQYMSKALIYQNELDQAISISKKYFKDLGDMMSGLLAFRKEISSILNGIKHHTEGASQLLIFLQQHYAHIDSLKSETDSFKKSQRAQSESITQAFQATLQKLSNNNQEAWNTLRKEREKSIKLISDAVVSLVGEHEEKLTRQADTFDYFLSKLLENQKNRLTTTEAEVESRFDKVDTKLETMAQAQKENVSNVITQFEKQIEDFQNIQNDKMDKFLNETIEKVETAVSSAEFNKLNNKVSEVEEKMGQVISSQESFNQPLLSRLTNTEEVLSSMDHKIEDVSSRIATSSSMNQASNAKRRWFSWLFFWRKLPNNKKDE